MAYAKLVIRVHLLDVETLTDLCPNCWLPALVRATFATSANGRALSGMTATICVDCGAQPEES